MSEAAAAKLK
jgi:hypothetical protein